MLRSQTLARACAAVGVVGLVAGLWAAPAGSQAAPDAVLTVGGSAQCVIVDDVAQWAVTFTAANVIPVSPITSGSPPQDVPPTIEVVIQAAPVTVGTEAVGDVAFAPNPVPQLQTAVVALSVPAGFAGPVSITVDWTVPDIDASGSEEFQLAITGTCAVPTPPTVEAAAVATTPTFTG